MLIELTTSLHSSKHTGRETHDDKGGGFSNKTSQASSLSASLPANMCCQTWIMRRIHSFQKLSWSIRSNAVPP